MATGCLIVIGGFVLFFGLIAFALMWSASKLLALAFLFLLAIAAYIWLTRKETEGTVPRSLSTEESEEIERKVVMELVEGSLETRAGFLTSNLLLRQG